MASPEIIAQRIGDAKHTTAAAIDALRARGHAVASPPTVRPNDEMYMVSLWAWIASLAQSCAAAAEDAAHATAEAGRLMTLLLGLEAENAALRDQVASLQAAAEPGLSDDPAPVLDPEPATAPKRKRKE